MPLFVRGIKHSEGVYLDRPYDNMVLHCLADSDGRMVVGEPVEHVKFKTPVFQSLIDRKKITCNDIVGREVRIIYNRFGNPDDFDLL